MSRHNRFLVGIAFAAMLSGNLPAQSIYGTLTGIVSDPSQAVVAGAALKLRDQQSGSQRDTVTNTDGYYTFSSVPPGAYQLTVVAKGFETHKQSDIALGGGDKLNYNVTLKVGNTSNVVEVSGSVDVVVPVDSGENSNRLTTKELDNFIQLGSNAAEFIKIMPGFGITNGTSNSANYNGQTIGINGNGNGGNQSPLNGAYSYNGLPANSLDITADGAHVSDPGCNCATPVNPNSKMISEFKVTMSNFSAENQKGPGVISSVAKGGGNTFHGSAFVSARNAVLNANDWLSNYSRVARPENQYYYPGFTLGGPVLLPFTKFNRKRDKLFFFTGYQYFYQVLDTGLLRATVPTLGERDGDFSPGGNRQGRQHHRLRLRPRTAQRQGPRPVPRRHHSEERDRPEHAGADEALPRCRMPTPTPTAATTGWTTCTSTRTTRSGCRAWTTASATTPSCSSATTCSAKCSSSRSASGPATVTQQVPYPTPMQGKNRSDSVTASLTHVFNSSMTNEFVFGYTFIGFPNVFQDPVQGGPDQDRLQLQGPLQEWRRRRFPNIGSIGEVAGISNQGGFEVGGPSQGLYANKYMPSASDNISKIWGKHTLKAGVFWEHIRNAQPANNTTQGALSFNAGNSNTMGNPYADMLLGNLNSYSETSFNRINDIYYNTYEGFIQDSWKVNRRLTLELGLRITHFAPWADNLGFGFSVFDYSKYNSSCTPTQYCGFLWNKRDPSVPLGGFPTKGAYYQPRFGVAYALERFHRAARRLGTLLLPLRPVHHRPERLGRHADRHPEQQPGHRRQHAAARQRTRHAELRHLRALHRRSRPQGRQEPRTPTATASPSRSACPGRDWSKWPTSATQSRNLLNQTRRGQRHQPGAGGRDALVEERRRGSQRSEREQSSARCWASRDLPLATHNLYANYNSLQVKYMRTKGRAVINMNYTFGKALGIVSSTLDSFNLNNDYGVQSTNRTHIFNAAYSYNFGDLVRNRLAGGFVNGWQVSGIVQVQSGVNLTGQRGQTFGMALNSAKIPGTTQNISTTSLLGTPNITLSIRCNTHLIGPGTEF